MYVYIYFWCYHLCIWYIFMILSIKLFSYYIHREICICMHIILNVLLTIDKIKPLPTEWIALTDNLTWIQVKLTMTLASLLTTTTKLIIWAASILHTHTRIDCNCKSLPTSCASRKENENGLSKSFISFIQSKRKQQQLNKERRREAKQLSLNYNMLKRGEYACVHVCLCVSVVHDVYFTTVNYHTVVVVVEEVGVEIGKTITCCQWTQPMDSSSPIHKQTYIQFYVVL